MDDLTEKLAASFEITFEPNKTSAPHPRYAQYKAKSSTQDQDSRRKKLLEIQKSRRFDYLSLVRNLTDGDWKEEAAEEATEEVEDDMEVQAEWKKPGRYYKDQLMMSEWLVDVPVDFKTEWMMVLCPVAKRCLVVASRGTTRAFTKSGYCLMSFPSHLPGGYRKNKARDTTLLDCLYSEAAGTFYILDMMCWNGHPIYDSETEFRFYWLHDKMQEFPDLGVKTNINPYKFLALPSFKCEQEDIGTAVLSAKFEIDGLLFFHKRTHYTFGSTPLVVWLKPYMLQEILGITVPDSQMTHMPTDYTNYADHMKKVQEDKIKFEEEKLKRQQQGFSPNSRGRGRGTGRGRGRGRGRNRGNGEMDTSDLGSEGGEEDVSVSEMDGEETTAHGNEETEEIVSGMEAGSGT